MAVAMIKESFPEAAAAPAFPLLLLFPLLSLLAAVVLPAASLCAGAADCELSLLEPQPANRPTARDNTSAGTKPRISFFVIISHLIILFAWSMTRCINLRISGSGEPCIFPDKITAFLRTFLVIFLIIQ